MVVVEVKKDLYQLLSEPANAQFIPYSKMDQTCFEDISKIVDCKGKLIAYENISKDSINRV